jgi:hypothetical protein
MPKIIIPLISGWEKECYYHVEASFSDSDEIKGYVLYIDKTDKNHNAKSGYFLNTEFNLRHAIYIRVLNKLVDKKYVDNVPRKYKIVKDYYPF